MTHSPSAAERTALPVQRDLTLAYWLSAVIGLLTAAASLLGVLNPAGAYPSQTLIQSFVPNDVVNLSLGVPLLAGALWLARRGQLVGLLCWPGAILYALYTYLIYLFLALAATADGGTSGSSRRACGGRHGPHLLYPFWALGPRRTGETMNRTTRTTVAALGALLGVSGMNHGFFETLQGNHPTGGLLINAIGAGNPWTRLTQGGEGAFTLVPNFLATGLLAMATGLAIGVWSIGFVHRPRGPLVLFLLFVGLTLVGGGIGQIVFFCLVCALATQIGRPLTRWDTLLPAGPRLRLARLWPGALCLTIVLFVCALEIAIFGYVPGVNDLARSQYIDWSILGVGLAMLLLTFAAAIARDLARPTQAPPPFSAS